MCKKLYTAVKIVVLVHCKIFITDTKHILTIVKTSRTPKLISNLSITSTTVCRIRRPQTATTSVFLRQTTVAIGLGDIGFFWSGLPLSYFLVVLLDLYHLLIDNANGFLACAKFK